MRHITERSRARLSPIPLAAMGALIVSVTNVTAATIFESGTLGPTGIPQGSVPATNITPNVFTGVRFELTQRVITTQVGGHFVDRNNGTFFGAIVELDDASDFPDSGDLSTPDVLGAAMLTFPVPSAEVFGELELSLDPGWYALVFGSGLFGTIGDGAAPRNGSDIGNPTYIGWQPGAVLGWGNLINPVFRNHRFVVHGYFVPEPGGFGMLSFVLIAVIIRSRNRQ